MRAKVTAPYDRSEVCTCHWGSQTFDIVLRGPCSDAWSRKKFFTVVKYFSYNDKFTRALGYGDQEFWLTMTSLESGIHLIFDPENMNTFKKLESEYIHLWA